ncbi:helix-turn-helix domain-containing protein [Aquimarina macrocephali]|uniref:helix-turn-helix domain-containing protein n=1 Tax=Aquimarina macrocephali TaxID=666563 RepID=UPI003F6726F0
MKAIDHKYITAFGKHLRGLRKKSKLSQEQLANDADIPISQVGRIERGEVNTTVSTMRALSKALKIHITELFDFDKD